MTAAQAVHKMTQNTKTNNLDLIYNWVKQGKLRSKDFKEVMRKLNGEDEEEEEEPHRQTLDRYAENRRLVKEDLEKHYHTFQSSSGGGKRKKKG